MSLHDYRTALAEQYLGEVSGEAFFSRLLAQFSAPRQRHVLASMLQLETETKARLRPAVAALGIDPVEADAARATGASNAAQLQGLDWAAAMAALADRLVPFTHRYREIADLAPPEFRALADAMVTHEQILLALARGEAGGNSNAALDALERHLMFPLPRSD